MVTTPKNSPWHERIEVQKGDYGEFLVQKHLEAKGYIIYRPDTDGAHGFDMLAYKDGRYQFAVEVKTKPMCRKYPETGFNYRLYERYVELSEANSLPVAIFFVDEDRRAIYGNFLSELEKPLFVKELGNKGHYPKTVGHTGGNNLTRYYHESSLKHVRDLTDAEVETLKSFTADAPDKKFVA